MSAAEARAHDSVDNRPRVDWLALEDDVWRAVAKFLRLDVYTLRRTCKALRRILPLADVPKAVQRARKLAACMRNLDHFRAPMGTTPENLLERKYSYDPSRRVPLFPKRSNALRTVDLLLEAPLGELCEALGALRESSPQLKRPFANWLYVQPVHLTLRHRLIALRDCRELEHLVGSALVRPLPREEFGEAIKLFYDLGLITKSPTYVELCQLWYNLACFGHHELMRELWESHFTEGWEFYATHRRRRALLTWRCDHQMTALEATESAWNYRTQDAEERFGDDPGALNHLKEDIQGRYPPTIALLKKLCAQHLTPAMMQSTDFLNEDGPPD